MECSNWKMYIPFRNAIVFEIPMKYVFEYEEEFFDVRSPEGRRTRIVVERLPKRNWLKLKEIFPHSVVHIMLELYPSDIQGLKENKDRTLKDLKSDAFMVLRTFIIAYRRLMGSWVNFHPLESPNSPEEFFRDIERYYFVSNGKIMPRAGRDLSLDYPMVISVGKSMSQYQKATLESYMQFLIYPLPDEARLFEIFEMFDAAIINYIKRNYPVSLVLSVTSMEAMLQWFIFETSAKRIAMTIKKVTTESELRDKYRDAGGLVTRNGKGKVPRFLIPIARVDENIAKELQNLMKDLKCVYDARSKFVHEGALVKEQGSKLALNVASEFISILLQLAKKIEKKKRLYWIFKYHLPTDYK